MGQIVPIMFFYKVVSIIKYAKKVDTLLNKETTPKHYQNCLQ